MIKKFFTIFLCFALILNLCPIHLFAAEETGSFTVTADKAEANPGDTINFTVSLQQTGTLGAFEFEVSVPTGLTYVAGSIKATDNLKETLLFDDVGVADSTKIYMNGYGSKLADSYSGTEALQIATFQCTVDENASYSSVSVTLNNTIINDGYLNEKTGVTVTPVSIEIKQKPIPATAISISPTEQTLKAGETLNITTTITPNNTTDTVSWKSSNATVASVDNTGLVTAKTKGSATITATINGISATCAITVTCAHSNVVTHPAVQSTCLVQGNAEYQQCSDCGEITAGSNAKLPLGDHNYGAEIAEVPATHATTGTKAHYVCSVCTKIFDTNKKEVTAAELEIPVQPHNYGDDKFEDDEYHAKECGCGNIVKEKHTGGEATCSKKAICDVCKTEYGKLDSTNHINTELQNKKDATCTEKGNTGDTYCLDCKTTIKNGEEKPSLGHTGGEATCSLKAVCTRCDTEYGKLDSTNHKNTEVRDAVEPTTTTEGYTGDTYCLDCKEKIKTGTAIPKFVYEVIDGMNGKHTKGNTTSLAFKTNGDMKKLDSIEVNGTKVEATNYTVKADSTAVITLKAEYLNSLVVGSHKIEFIFTDGKTETNFSVEEKVVPQPAPSQPSATPSVETVTTAGATTTITNPNSPQTGDNSNVMLWISGIIISGICFVIILKWNTKKQAKKVTKH